MIYMLLVFLAGCSYGLLAPLYKLAYNLNFTVAEVVGSQYYAGLLMLLIINLIFLQPKLKVKQMLPLMVVGSTTALTGIFYGQALQTLPAAVGIVFLFQFSWIGIIIESVAQRKWPTKDKLFSIPFLLAGALMAGGIFELSELNINLYGALWGLLAAFTYALYIFLSGRVNIEVPAINRTFYIMVGAVLTISIIYPPSFLINGALTEGLLFYGILLGLFGCLIPSLFFAKAIPHIGSGLASILSSSELPAAVLTAGILLNEQVSFLRWLGIIITLIGISSPYLYSQYGLKRSNRK